MQEQLNLAPVGELHFPNLQTPRSFQNDESKLAYDTGLRIFDVQAAADFIYWIDAWRAEAAQENGGQLGLKTPAKVDLVDEEGRQFSEVKFRLKAAIQTKKGLWERRPVILNADGSAFPDTVSIGSGTIAQIHYSVHKWCIGGEAGITLQPLGVMIHELPEYTSGGGAASPGDVRAVMLESAITPPTAPQEVPPPSPVAAPSPATPPTTTTPPPPASPNSGASNF